MIETWLFSAQERCREHHGLTRRDGATAKRTVPGETQTAEASAGAPGADVRLMLATGSLLA